MLSIIRYLTKFTIISAKYHQSLLKVMPQYNAIKHMNNSINTNTRNVYLIDEDNNKEELKNGVNKYTNRTFTCGDLRKENVGQKVVLCGWLEYQRMNKFIVLRDSYGETQILFKEKDKKAQEALENLSYESIIEVKGTVITRPENMRNKQQKTGDIEILMEDLQILNPSKDNLPFNIREFQKAKESLRMQYRYLDLRFPQMQRNLRIRSEMLMKMREYLVNYCKFVDVETPTLFKATPGGAQEFIVPTRFPGQFYSLVQSPQQFKQMLMAGAVDRYFQIARCYRDEGARSDRQPEFTQLDIEMSFTNVEAILNLVEDLLNYSWPDFLNPLPKTFARMNFDEALENYGSDAPDVRFDFTLQNCTDILKKNTKFETENFGAYYILFPKQYANLSKSIKEKMNELSKQCPKTRLIQTKVSNHKEFLHKLNKSFTTYISLELSRKINPTEDSVVFLAYGDRLQTLKLLGKIRVEYVDLLENLGLTIRKKGMHFTWILNFPLFEISEETQKLNCAHHPFTAPNPDDLHLLDSNPLEMKALAYDLVLNGNEIGGGSIRIHSPELQEKVFKLLQINVNSMKHMLEMLSFGCPPHGGIALGLDRLLSKILQTTSIRDVIAFPKTFEGRDPLSGAPSEVSEAEKKLYHIKTV